MGAPKGERYGFAPAKDSETFKRKERLKSPSLTEDTENGFFKVQLEKQDQCIKPQKAGINHPITYILIL